MAQADWEPVSLSQSRGGWGKEGQREASAESGDHQAIEQRGKRGEEKRTRRWQPRRTKGEGVRGSQEHQWCQRKGPEIHESQTHLQG